MLFAAPGAPMMAVLGALAAIFAAHGARTWVRSATRITVDDEGIAAHGPRNASVRWSGLERMSVDYYSTRRDGSKGWMQMRISGEGTSLRLDSTLDGFAQVVRRAASEAAKRGITLPAATHANLAALGMTTGRGNWPIS
jgi:hypothetical protein